LKALQVVNGECVAWVIPTGQTNQPFIVAISSRAKLMARILYPDLELTQPIDFATFMGIASRVDELRNVKDWEEWIPKKVPPDDASRTGAFSFLGARDFCGWVVEFVVLIALNVI